jgi:hypothetical protein
MPVTSASMKISAASRPKRRRANAPTDSSRRRLVERGRSGSLSKASLPRQLSSGVRSRAAGPLGRACSRSPTKTKRLRRADSPAAISRSPSPNSRQSSMVAGLLSNTPFGPVSMRKPSTCSVQMLPPGRGDCSSTTTSHAASACRNRYATANPLMPPPTTTTRRIAVVPCLSRSARSRPRLYRLPARPRSPGPARRLSRPPATEWGHGLLY